MQLSLYMCVCVCMGEKGWIAGGVAVAAAVVVVVGGLSLLIFQDQVNGSITTLLEVGYCSI